MSTSKDSFGGFVEGAKVSTADGGRSAGLSRHSGTAAGAGTNSVVAPVGLVAAKALVTSVKKEGNSTAIGRSRHVEESSPDIVGTKLIVRHAFGYGYQQADEIVGYQAASRDRGDVSDRVIFRVGKTIAIVDPDGINPQKFFSNRLKNVTKVLHISISKNNKFLCVCESTRNSPAVESSISTVVGEHHSTDKGHAQLSVFSLGMANRLKTLTKASSTAEFVQAAFLADAKYLAALLDSPEEGSQVIVYLWDKDKLHKHIVLPSRVKSICSKLFYQNGNF